MSVLPNDLEPVSNHILFQFLDKTSKSQKGAFENKTNWGFQLKTSIDETTKAPRWVKIIGLGPDAEEEFHVGQVVLVKPLKWTRQVEYNGVEFARTDNNHILAIDEDT